LSQAARRQRGAALIVAMVILVLLASAVLLDRLNAAVAPSASRDPASATALANAKQALIAWAATHPNTPGLLPFPDRNEDGTYDGVADCVSPGTIAAGHLLGRFPIRGEQTASGCVADFDMSVEVVDSGGAPLWYAVSRNLVGGGGGGPINPDIGELAAQPWITVRDQNGAIISNRVAAVIIAPGPALSGQNRIAIDTDPLVEYPRYLESITFGGNTFSNADADGCLDDNVGCGTPESEDFIIYPTTADVFNDRLVYITIDELMRAVEDRVLGEAATALRNYRGNNPGNFFPWLSPFTNPRTPQGAAEVGSGATSLVDTGTDFVAAGVLDGDLVRNLTDGSIGMVATGGVTTTTLTLVGLIGGSSNTFAPGDRYVVHAANKFQGRPLPSTTEGLLPLHMPNEVFKTGFTVNWNFSGEKNSDTFDDGNTNLIPTVNDVDNFSSDLAAGDVTIPAATGECKWTTVNRVDCRGITTLFGYVRSDNGLTVDRTVEVWFNFTANPGATTITAPTATDVRRRNHTFDGPNNGPVTPLPAPDMPQNAWAVHVEDTDGVNRGWRRAERDGSTNLVINKFEGIRYEIGVGDELPAWFVENNWHHFIYAALSNDVVFGGNADADDDCSTPVDTCLSIQYNAVPVNTALNAVVIGPGPVLVAQDRTIGDCDGDSVFDDFLCAYFEIPNNDLDRVFGRAPANTFEVNATFNDHVRPVP
jgi:hypothetical protein